MRHVIVFLWTWIAVFPARAQHPGAILDNNRAMDELEKKNAYGAYDKLIEALSQDPFNPAIRLNLGVVFEVNEEMERALKEYQAVERSATQDPAMRFAGLFNAARVAAQLDQIDLALRYYQQALEIVPDSKEVKTNIELLWRQGQGKGKGKKNQKPDPNQQGDQGERPEEQKEPKDGQGDQNQEIQNGKKEPRPFESRELSKEDVRKILEEIKNQEQSIRAKEYGKEIKERPRDKDW